MQSIPSVSDLQRIAADFLKDRKDLRNVDVLSQWRLLMTEQEIQIIVSRLAQQLNDRFSSYGQEIVVVCILKGCVYYFVDLTRQLTFPHSTYFIEASSYRDSQKQEQVEILSKLVPSKFKGKKVILLDELYDNGTTLQFVRNALIDPKNALGVANQDIFSSTVFLKERPDGFVHPHPLPDLVGINIPDLWVVGYGLDDRQEKRGWNALYGTPKTPGAPKIKEDQIFEDGPSGIAMYNSIREKLIGQIYSKK